MIIFEQLRLSDNAQKMYVCARVNKADYFKDIYIERVVIMTSDKVLEATTPDLYPTDTEGNPIDCIYTKKFDDNTKEINLVLTASDFAKTYETEASKMKFTQADMSNTLFFVYIKCKGTVGECVPCRLDELTTLGVTFDDKLLYQKVMDYTKGLAGNCTVPVGFADFILLWYAFKAAIETEHYIPAIKYWNMLFGKDGYYIGNNVESKGCGCHG